MKICAVVFLLCLAFVDSKKSKPTVLILNASLVEWKTCYYQSMRNRTRVLQFFSLMKRPEANLLA